MSVTSIDKDFDNRTLTLIADFDAPVERVWELWADPRKLERWWGPPGYPATFEEHDLTPGGAVTYFMTTPEGERSRGWWRITSVDPPRSLEFTDGFAGEDGTPVAGMPVSTVRIRLTERDGGTRMEMRSVFESREQMEQLVSLGAVEGLQQAVGQMDGLLEAKGRRLKLQTQVTADGYMAGPDGEMDWMTFPWSDDVGAYIDATMRGVDTIVLGRKLAEGFIPAWASGPEGEDQASIDWMNDTPKVVISNSLGESPWENAVVAGGDLAETIGRLKAEPGGDMIAYGGGTLVSSLIAGGLIDEIRLFVNPTAIGAGMPVFGARQELRLVEARPFECGITAMHYAPR